MHSLLDENGFHFRSGIHNKPPNGLFRSVREPAIVPMLFEFFRNRISQPAPSAAAIWALKEGFESSGSVLHRSLKNLNRGVMHKLPPAKPKTVKGVKDGEGFSRIPLYTLRLFPRLKLLRPFTTLHSSTKTRFCYRTDPSLPFTRLTLSLQCSQCPPCCALRMCSFS